jgi:hypothetical protein
MIRRGDRDCAPLDPYLTLRRLVAVPPRRLTALGAAGRAEAACRASFA